MTFDDAPAIDTVLTLERVLPLERLTDFLEGGEFAADAINTELDFFIAALQQVSRAQQATLRYDDTEAPGQVTLPPRSQRKNKALGFDGNGDIVPVSLAGSMAAPDFTAAGTGAATRTSSDKFSDLVSIKDFGAVGDGTTDDTLAIQKALSAHDAVLVPSGTYLTSATIQLAAQKSLIGTGQKSVIRANGDAFNVIEMIGDYAALSGLRLEQGAVGLKLIAGSRPCVQNSVTDVTIWQAQTGILLDGSGTTSAKNPCYWNNFDRVLVAQPAVHGVI